jgi:hypothetical protein
MLAVGFGDETVKIRLNLNELWAGQVFVEVGRSVKGLRGVWVHHALGE